MHIQKEIYVTKAFSKAFFTRPDARPKAYNNREREKSCIVHSIKKRNIEEKKPHKHIYKHTRRSVYILCV